MPTAEELDLITSLLKEGRVQEAADLSAQLSADAKAADDAAAGKVPEPPPPRGTAPIVSDLLREIVAHLGHTPRMSSLLDELTAAESRVN